MDLVLVAVKLVDVEIRLKDTDLVHEILTALGVSSLNSNGIGPADDSLKFIIYKIERQPVNKMLTFSYNQTTRDYSVKDITMLDLVKKVKSDFNIVGGIQMYNPDTEKYISDKAKAVQVYDKIQRDEKALIIITKSNSMTRSTQPKPLSALNTHRSIIEREQTPIAKSAGGSSINSASVDFDGMLDDLDTNIGFQKVKLVKLSTKMDNLEHEIDKLVATSPEKSQPKLLNKASRRLSKIHGESNSPNSSPSKKDKNDPEAQDILEMIGTSKAELLVIEQNMMILVGQLLSKNGIIIK